MTTTVEMGGICLRRNVCELDVTCPRYEECMDAVRKDVLPNGMLKTIVHRVDASATLQKNIGGH